METLVNDIENSFGKVNLDLSKVLKQQNYLNLKLKFLESNFHNFQNLESKIKNIELMGSYLAKQQQNHEKEIQELKLNTEQPFIFKNPSQFEILKYSNSEFTDSVIEDITPTLSSSSKINTDTYSDASFEHLSQTNYPDINPKEITEPIANTTFESPNPISTEITETKPIDTNSDEMRSFLQKIKIDFKTKSGSRRKFIKNFALKQWWSYLPENHSFKSKADLENYIIENIPELIVTKSRNPVFRLCVDLK